MPSGIETCGGAAGGAGAVRDEDAQAAVVAFLASSAAWNGETPRHVLTHISHLFIGKDRALKLKRAVALPFVDATDPERRRLLCETEIAVNRPNAPGIYLGTLPVVRTADGLALGGEGEAVDHVVHMRAFDTDNELDRLFEAGRLDGPRLDRTAEAIAALHARAPVRRVPDGAARVRSTVDQIARDLLSMEGGGAVRPVVEDWAARARAAEEALGPLFDRRGRHGFVRRCHGDLHLGNMCLWQGEPTAFDAIEFDEALAVIDVLYDLAFVIADLISRGGEGAANRLLNRYLEGTRDYRGAAALPLFASMRAMVRALVAAARGDDPSRWAGLAARLVRPPTGGLLVAVGGQSGTGKSTLARGLAEGEGALVVRTDAVRKRLFGRRPEERLPAEAYAEDVSRRVYRTARVDAARALAARFPVILDGTFLDADERAAAEALAARADADFQGLWLVAGDGLVAERVAGRAAAPGRDASDADGAVAAAQAEAAAARPEGWEVIAAEGQPDEVLARAGPRVPTGRGWP